MREPNLESEVVSDEDADPDAAHVEPVQEAVGLRHAHKIRQKSGARDAGEWGGGGGGIHEKKRVKAFLVLQTTLPVISKLLVPEMLVHCFIKGLTTDCCTW